MQKPRYTAILSDGTVAYRNQPNGNLIGSLPSGAYPSDKATVLDDNGYSVPNTFLRWDGGDVFENAIFELVSGRTVVVSSQHPHPWQRRIQ